MTRKAIELLTAEGKHGQSAKHGLFLQVEGASTDKQNHCPQQTTVTEGIPFSTIVSTLLYRGVPGARWVSLLKLKDFMRHPISAVATAIARGDFGSRDPQYSQKLADGKLIVRARLRAIEGQGSFIEQQALCDALRTIQELEK